MTIKIYHQNQIIYLSNHTEISGDHILVNPSKDLIQTVFFNPQSDTTYYLVNKNFEALKTAVYQCFKIIEAAGGLVSNLNNEILLMFRRGSWDLPKGKIDDGETAEIAAVREVEEETGIKNVQLLQFITTTYHTYFYKNNWALKPTHWFKMSIDTEQPLIPQTEEDIEMLEWVKKDDLAVYLKNMYPSIKDVVSAE